MDTKWSHNNYVRIDAINSFNKPNEDDETITDFTVLIDKVVEHMRANSLTMVNLVEDMVHIGFMCFEDGSLFQMSKTDAYSSIRCMTDNRMRAIYARAVYREDNTSGTLAHEIYRSSLIDKIVRSVKNKPIELCILQYGEGNYEEREFLESYIPGIEYQGTGWYVWENLNRKEGCVAYFDHDPTDEELKKIYPTYVRANVVRTPHNT
jgi:hypothetical protein